MLLLLLLAIIIITCFVIATINVDIGKFLGYDLLSLLLYNYLLFLSLKKKVKRNNINLLKIDDGPTYSLILLILLSSSDGDSVLCDKDSSANTNDINYKDSITIFIYKIIFYSILSAIDIYNNWKSNLD